MSFAAREYGYKILSSTIFIFLNFTGIYHFNCNKNVKNSGKGPICLIIVFMIMIVLADGLAYCGLHGC